MRVDYTMHYEANGTSIKGPKESPCWKFWADDPEAKWVNVGVAWTASQFAGVREEDRPEPRKARVRVCAQAFGKECFWKLINYPSSNGLENMYHPPKEEPIKVPVGGPKNTAVGITKPWEHENAGVQFWVPCEAELLVYSIRLEAWA